MQPVLETNNRSSIESFAPGRPKQAGRLFLSYCGDIAKHCADGSANIHMLHHLRSTILGLDVRENDEAGSSNASASPRLGREQQNLHQQNL